MTRGRSHEVSADGADTYRPKDYPPFALTVDLVVLTLRDDAAHVLLVRRGQAPYRSRWALPGGFVGIDEDLADAATRELAEETGVAVEVAHLEQLGTYGAPRRDPRMRVVSVAYLGILADLPEAIAGSDADDARWWPIDALPRPGALAFDHTTILADGIERARSKLEYTTLATRFVAPEFTLAELRGVYEAVWGHPLHPSNFARKVTGSAGFVEPTGRIAAAAGGAGRPAQLYRHGGALLVEPPLLRGGVR